MYKKTFEKLFIWESSKELFEKLYKIFSGNFKDYFFRDQILRATLSISNNIAEWYERETNKELIRFLYIAKGSTGEVRNMIIIAHDLQYITNEQFDTYIEVLNKISAWLKSMIESKL